MSNTNQSKEEGSTGLAQAFDPCDHPECDRRAGTLLCAACSSSLDRVLRTFEAEGIELEPANGAASSDSEGR